MQTQIKFLVGGANSLIGGFVEGDRARVPDDLAKHLVEVGVAAFDEADPAPEQPAKATKGKK